MGPSTPKVDAYASEDATKVPPAPVGPEGATQEARFQRMFWKTTSCSFFTQGCCKRGNRCGFAHGNVEVRAREDLTKTALCKHWLRNACRHSARACKFAHGFTDLQDHKFHAASGKTYDAHVFAGTATSVPPRPIPNDRKDVSDVVKAPYNAVPCFTQPEVLKMPWQECAQQGMQACLLLTIQGMDQNQNSVVVQQVSLPIGVHGCAQAGATEGFPAVEFDGSQKAKGLKQQALLQIQALLAMAAPDHYED